MSLRLIRSGLALYCALISLEAEDLAGTFRSSIVNPFTDIAIPHVVAGGGWKTKFILVNMDTKASKYTLLFGDTEGRDLQRTIEGLGPGTGVTGTIAVNGSIFVETSNSGPLVQGYAVLATNGVAGFDGKVAGYAVFSNQVAGRPDFEAVVPIAKVNETRMRIPFDNTAGFATGVAVLNFDSVASTISVACWDGNGVVLSCLGRINLAALGQRAFNLAEQFPILANKRGVIELSTSGKFLSAIGLRFNPTGSFTSIGPLSLSDWNP
jgi:hypothetical protein